MGFNLNNVGRRGCGLVKQQQKNFLGVFGVNGKVNSAFFYGRA
jgi:hypothetical protein